LFGGEDGAVGINTLNNKHRLASKGSHELKAGDRIRIETPGGGGWGSV
jgi:N-methylhydantoinase B